jgi:hypothetical protein
VENFKRLENLTEGFWEVFQITYNLEATFRLIFSKDINLVSADKAAHNFSSSVLENFDNSFASAFKRNLVQNLASWIDHYGSFIAVNENILAEVSHLETFSASFWKLFSPSSFLRAVVKQS